MRAASGRDTAGATWVAPAVVALVLLVVLMVAWGASVGPGTVLRGDGNPPNLRTPPPSALPSDASASPTASASGAAVEGSEPGGPPTIRILALLLQVAAVLAAGYLVLVLVGRRREERRVRRRRRLLTAEASDLEVLRPPDVVARAIVADAGVQRGLLLEGTPRNAVVAVWHRFERQAADAGLAPQPWETSSEFTLRVLDLVEGDPAAVARLGTLYREARFSGHELTEADRQAALDAVDTIHRELRRAGSGTGRASRTTR